MFSSQIVHKYGLRRGVLLPLMDLGLGIGLEQVMRRNLKEPRRRKAKKMTCRWLCLGEAVVRRLGPQDMVPTGRSTDSLKYQHAQQPQTSTSIIPGPPFVPLLPQTFTRRAWRLSFFSFFFFRNFI